MANLLDAIKELLATQNQPQATRPDYAGDFIRKQFNPVQQMAQTNTPPQQVAQAQRAPVIPQNILSMIQQIQQPQQLQQPQQVIQEQPRRSNFIDLMVQLGIPLATAAAGLASDSFLPAAAGFNQGYTGQLEKQRERRFEKEKADAKQKGLETIIGLKTANSGGMSPSERNYKRKVQKDFSEQYAQNQSNRRFIKEAESLIDYLPEGLSGKAQLEYMKYFDSSNPILGYWQKVKAILTDTTLLHSMKTKGAISDKEMEEFKQAAANDSLVSSERIKAAFQRYRQILDAEDEGKINNFYQSFGEDPRVNINDGQGVLSSGAVESLTDEEIAQRIAELEGEQ